ncbi:MAG: AAA family ATPase [Candidatus Omnitrophota bacterium]|nr:AAA family ATPase [Candidatus Omnitrophota bacterium]
MSYYEALGLTKEPFSTSPDPAFFYRSSAHSTAIQRLEIAIRLKRGLSVILGDVGIGKTTMSRALLQTFANDEDYTFHIILDPSYKSEFQFLSSLTKMFGIKPDARSTLDYKEEIEKYLFRKGVDENKTVVLLIDECQKLSTPFLEVLRTLLNYETNEYKLLQLVMVSQMELLPRIKKIKNFYDRIALKYIINPLGEEETKEMIEFRLAEAGLAGPRKIFTDEAIRRIFEYAEGFPRRTSIICHNALEALVMHDRSIVDSALASKVIDRETI